MMFSGYCSPVLLLVLVIAHIHHEWLYAVLWRVGYSLARKLWTFLPSLWRRRKCFCVVARSHWRVYDFARAVGFQALFDRRRSQRRQNPMPFPRDIDRRVRDRRVRDITEDLRRFGWAIIDG